MLGVHFDGILTYRQHVETIAPKCKKGLSVLKATAAKGIEQRQLFLPSQSVLLSVIDYGLSLTTMAQTNLLKLDRVQKEALKIILGTIKDTPTGTMSSCETPDQCRKWSRAKGYTSALSAPHNQLHEAVKGTNGCRPVSYTHLTLPTNVQV